jgi:hypothetical protein
MEWCMQMNLNPYFIDVSHPDFYSPSNLPTSLKNLINKKFDIYLYKEGIPTNIVNGIRGSLQNMNDTELNNIVWQKFLKNNKFLDDSRNQKFEETFPELNSLI